jgi:hypothetical protein
VEFAEYYSTDSFLMALRRFMCIRGTLSQKQSDRGKQLLAASKQLEALDFNRASRWAGRKGIEWYLVPTEGKHFHGQAESMIRILKKQIERSFEDNRHSHEGVEPLLQEASQIMNSRPLSIRQRAEPESLSQADFLMGRATIQFPSTRF